MSHPSLSEVKELAKSSGSSVVMVGNRVYEASKYAPEIAWFPEQKYLLLNHYHAGMSLEEAATRSKMDLADAEAFIDSPRAVEYLRKRAIRDFIKRDYEEGKWVEVGDAVLEGKRQMRKDQQVVFSAFGDRFAPKPKQMTEGSKTTINFNFGPEAVKEAFRRQQSIESTLTQELGA